MRHHRGEAELTSYLIVLLLLSHLPQLLALAEGVERRLRDEGDLSVGGIQILVRQAETEKIDRIRG